MAVLPTFLLRPRAILNLPAYIAKGYTRTAWINELKAAGLSYRKTLMLADFRSQAGIEAKKDRAKYTRKDRTPSVGSIADVEWDLSKEYMYKVKVWVQAKPGEPLTERFVTVMSDELLKRREVEQEVFLRWETWKYPTEELREAELSEVRHRIKPLPGLED